MSLMFLWNEWEKIGKKIPTLLNETEKPETHKTLLCFFLSRSLYVYFGSLKVLFLAECWKKDAFAKWTIYYVLFLFFF